MSSMPAALSADDTSTARLPRILMAPMNFADQPMALVRALRQRGVDAHHLQYTTDGRHALGYSLDRLALMRSGDFRRQLDVLRAVLAEGFDIYHFWQRSLLFRPELDGLTGFDLPLIKARGAQVFHRFTGFDLRLPSEDRRRNPHSPFLHGFVPPFKESAQRQYIEMLRQHVDVFFVQDPEMQQFMPEARVLPRGLALTDWPYVGVRPNPRPLVVHAPSNAAVKGSHFIVRALEELSREGLRFDFRLLERVPHSEAQAWYRRADIIVDQIMIGATGVLTLEAWALGKPCVTYLREDLFQPFYGTRDLPVANATPVTIKSVLARLIKDHDWRLHLARRGRETVETFHDIGRVAEQYLEICQARGRRQAALDTRTRDLDFFSANFLNRLAENTVARRAPHSRHEVAPCWNALQLRAANLGQLNVRGRFEQGFHNGLARLFRAILSAEDQLFGGDDLRASPRVARLIALQVNVFRDILAIETRLCRELSHLRRACGAWLPGRD
ncbi:MAG: hypothetical protein K2Y51_20455 [Gammaproteobacteria bacterium]|nr:hypothetical protein [Gammaproteobacteria bacterium]